MRLELVLGWGQSTYFGVGRSDFWLVIFDSLGNEQLSQTYGASGMDMTYSIIEITAGGYALVGDTHSFGHETQIFG